MKTPHRRKQARNLALILLALSASVIAWQGMHGNHKTNQVQASGSGPTSSTLPATPSTPRSSLPLAPKTNSPKPSQTKPAKPPFHTSQNAQDAVDAAVLADVNLTLSQFQTPAQRRQIVHATVVPSLRSKYETVYNYTGKILADAYGYGNVSQVQSYAEYRINTLMTRVDRLTTNSATISLFNFTSFRERQDLVTETEHKDVSITVMMMKRVAGKWLLASSHPGPGPNYKPGQVVKFEQKYAAYQPLLRRFSNYAHTP